MPSPITKQSFRNLPINQKVMLMAMVVTSATLLLSGVGIVGLDRLLFRESLERDVAALGQIVADNSTAALSFDDRRVATETLASLRARPHMIAACLFGTNGELFSKYLRAGSVIDCPIRESLESTETLDAGFTVRTEAVLKGKKIGSLVLLYDLDEISLRTRLYGSIVVGVFLIGALLAFLLSKSLSTLITAPIVQLVAITSSVSETGNYGMRAERESSDELGVLVDRFNEMLAGIESRDQTLRKALIEREEALNDAERAKERFRFMAESMPQKIFTSTPEGKVNYLNRQWQDFSGLSVEAVLDAGLLQLIHPTDAEPNVQKWRQCIATGEPFLSEVRYRRADGEYRWHLSRAHALRDSQGEISMWIGSNTEIHEQKEKEAELRRVNEDLQQFVYSASHDLQEPVRNVAIYSEVVATRYREVLGEEGQQYLGFLKEGGRRLSMLIRDLLSYTTAGALDSPGTIVNAETILSNTVFSLAEAIRESGACVTYEGLPEVYMGEAHLQQLFQNLITNAIKYRKEDPPRIHVSARRESDAWCFCVQDNGIGIDPVYKEKIFGVFKRLHHNDKYGGTGIGLAICKRVVESYGGRIWVESEAGRGASFYFTTPIQDGYPSPESAVGGG